MHICMCVLMCLYIHMCAQFGYILCSHFVKNLHPEPLLLYSNHIKAQFQSQLSAFSMIPQIDLDDHHRGRGREHVCMFACLRTYVILHVFMHVCMTVCMYVCFQQWSEAYFLLQIPWINLWPHCKSGLLAHTSSTTAANSSKKNAYAEGFHLVKCAK